MLASRVGCLAPTPDAVISRDAPSRVWGKIKPSAVTFSTGYSSVPRFAPLVLLLRNCIRCPPSNILMSKPTRWLRQMMRVISTGERVLSIRAIQLAEGRLGKKAGVVNGGFNDWASLLGPVSLCRAPITFSQQPQAGYLTYVEYYMCYCIYSL